MTPEELLHELYGFIDRCFAGGMELGQVLREVESYLAGFDPADGI